MKCNALHAMTVIVSVKFLQMNQATNQMLIAYLYLESLSPDDDRLVFDLTQSNKFLHLPVGHYLRHRLFKLFVNIIIIIFLIYWHKYKLFTVYLYLLDTYYEAQNKMNEQAKVLQKNKRRKLLYQVSHFDNFNNDNIATEPIIAEEKSPKHKNDQATLVRYTYVNHNENNSVEYYLEPLTPTHKEEIESGI